MNKFLYKVMTPFPVILIVLLMIFMLSFPDICKAAAIKGIIICGQVIIPTLFPFTFCVLFIVNSNTVFLKSINKTMFKLFRLSTEEFTVMILSVIGGYPTGAKLISKLYDDKLISEKKAQLMLCYCVNAGPAFIVMAIGQGVLHSAKIGYILLIAHIIPAFLFAFVLKFFMPEMKKHIHKTTHLSYADNIVVSAADSATAILNICGYVILFCVFNTFAYFYSEKILFLKYIIPFLEVTNAVTQTNNIYFVSFLTGFGGICVWCQVKGMLKNIKMNFPLFAIARIIHGILSAIITRFLFKIFKISISTISNNIPFKTEIVYSSYALSISLLIMGAVFVISTSCKKEEIV